MKQVVIFYFMVCALTACTQFSSEFKRTKEENDSLKLQLKKSEAEITDILSILNAIEEDIQNIRLSEDLVNIRKDSELSESRREQFKNNMSLINETLKKNRLKLNELQEKLNASNFNKAALQKTIDRLSKDMSEKGEQIIQLQRELEKKAVHIEQLSNQIDELHADVQALESTNRSQTEVIYEQDQTLNTVYYCFGTKKELKEQNILTGGGLLSKTKALQGNFNHDYFLVSDKRNLQSIPLFSSKAALKTSHPANSYQFTKDKEGNLTLVILHSSAFWGLSNFLVIEVK